jgi:hypothetical protein
MVATAVGDASGILGRNGASTETDQQNNVPTERGRAPQQFTYLKFIPRTINECDQMRTIINGDITGIQLQLHDGARRDTMEMSRFLDWERRAKKALIYKQAQLRELKMIRHTLVEQARLPQCDPRSDSALLYRCAQMFMHLSMEGVEFTPAERAFIDILVEQVGLILVATCAAVLPVTHIIAQAVA